MLQVSCRIRERQGPRGWCPIAGIPLPLPNRPHREGPPRARPLPLPSGSVSSCLSSEFLSSPLQCCQHHLSAIVTYRCGAGRLLPNCFHTKVLPVLFTTSSIFRNFQKKGFDNQSCSMASLFQSQLLAFFHSSDFLSCKSTISSSLF